ncbi:hypothetical protein bthur0011_59170 [Bacillus thuringiensis serovar huazhongensis BGSC 4BD1]|nr:hypothetical protein bthur0011_59170 [Bacillus thuringiensis serovar huazhongensis BGSC 4BD1]
MLYTIPNEHTIGDFEAIGGVTFSEKDKQFIQQMYPFYFLNTFEVSYYYYYKKIKQY